MKTYTLPQAVMELREALYLIADSPATADERDRIVRNALNILEWNCPEWEETYKNYLETKYGFKYD